MGKENILDFDLKEIEGILSGWGVKPFHARQVFSWLYKKGATDFKSMSDIPAGLRERLEKEFSIFTAQVRARLASGDGTEKFLLELNDGNLIEMVSIPALERVTGCVSTQAGCRFACRFCASGLGGFKRNLTKAEIIQQALYLISRSQGHKLTHLVFMGTGEPLDNYDNVLGAIRIINSGQGLRIGARRITISTCGIIPGIKRLAGEGLQVELCVSLHSADDKDRSYLLPVNKKYPLKDLMRACAGYIKETGRQVTFEYVLIRGLNSDLQNARKLSKILHGLNCKVNLIPVNPVEASRIAPPNKLEILFFKDYLSKQGINATLRKPRGQDIEAACGQLKAKYEKK